MEKKTAIILLAILALGLGLRVYNLGSESIWLDEGYALREALNPSAKAVIASLHTYNGTPPAYYLLLHYTIQFIGSSEFALRLPSALLGTLLILLVFLIGSEISEKVGLIGAAITGFSTIHILYAQEARAYALLSVFGILSSYIFIKFLKNPKMFTGILYSFFAASVIYTHYLGFVLLVLHAAAFFIVKEHTHLTFKHWCRTQLGILLLYIPNASLFIDQLKNLQKVLPTHLINLGVPASIAKLGGFVVAIPTIIFAIVIPLIPRLKKVLTAQNLVQKIKIAIRNQNTVLVVAAIFFASYIIFIPRFTSSFFLTRYTHFLFPFLYIGAACVFMNQTKRAKQILSVFFIVATLFALFTYYHNAPRKEQWREAAAFIESKESAGELIIVIDQDSLIPFEYYYNGNRQRIGFPTYLDKEKNEQILLQAEPMLLTYRGYWVVFSRAKKEQGVYSGYFKNYHLKGSRFFKGIEVYHYQ